MELLKRTSKIPSKKSELEKILRDVNSEVKNIGSPNVATINRFTKLFNMLSNELTEERNIEEVEGVLFYASRE